MCFPAAPPEAPKRVVIYLKKGLGVELGGRNPSPPSSSPVLKLPHLCSVPYPPSACSGVAGLFTLRSLTPRLCSARFRPPAGGVTLGLLCSFGRLALAGGRVKPPCLGAVG